MKNAVFIATSVYNDGSSAIESIILALGMNVTLTTRDYLASFKPERKDNPPRVRRNGGEENQNGENSEHDSQMSCLYDEESSDEDLQSDEKLIGERKDPHYGAGIAL